MEASMRRYFFDIRDGGNLVRDEEGLNLTTMDAVQNEAAWTLVEMAREDLRAGSGYGADRHLAIEVRDGERAVMRATFSFEVSRLH
jgi:hypothetical protein